MLASTQPRDPPHDGRATDAQTRLRRSLPVLGAAAPVHSTSGTAPNWPQSECQDLGVERLRSVR